ncbi:alpha-L-rhamnosidase [bacterium]|nr:MAG: alpha-L-rhamnosidase [bacterium]
MATNLSVADLLCEGFDSPLGLTEARPHLSWRLDSNRSGARQVAYRVRASSSPQGFDVPELWDSGRIESNQTAFIAYDGVPLYGRERVYWQVEVEDETGAITLSEVAFFETGLFKHSDWAAQFISAPIAGGPLTVAPVPRLTRTFSLEKPVKSARVYATAIGIYFLELNGKRVGDHELAPGWTDYKQSLRFQTFDVTEQLQSGDNLWRAYVGDGWGVGYLAWDPRQRYSDRPSILAQLEVEYEDGSHEIIGTDDKWTFALGPIMNADLLQGESYNAQLGWKEMGGVEVAPIPDNVTLRASIAPPVRVTEELAAVAVHNGGWLHGVGQGWVFDLGQNMVGRVRLNFLALKNAVPPGTTFRLRFAEVLKDGPLATTGRIYTENLRSAAQTDVVTSDGEIDSWEPVFTFHGFRYVEISGLATVLNKDEEPPLEFVTGVVMGTDMARRGDFECSDSLINQLQRNIDWGWRGNSVDIPTDCPQRDERLGWTGDAQVFCETANWNRDARGFWAEWARQVREAQTPEGGIPPVVPDTEVVKSPTGSADGGPAWADAVIICPWTTYRSTGDIRILEENYDVFERYVAFQSNTSRDYLRCYDGCGYFQGFGDWLALDGSGVTEGGTPKELVGTAFYAHSVNLLSKIATVLGKDDDAAKYTVLFSEIKTAFCSRFVTPEGRLSPPYQTPYLLALEFDLLPQQLRENAAKELVAEIRKNRNKLSTGFVGSPYINGVLTREGHLDVAYDLLHQKAWPSWLYAVTQNATTIWERWDGWTPEKGYQDAGMNSFNHYAYGAIGAWLYGYVAGIELDSDVPGYAKFNLTPRPGGELTWAKAHVDSAHGRIESEWHLEDGHFKYRFVVPANTSATVLLPEGTTFDAVAGIYEGQVEMK